MINLLPNATTLVIGVLLIAVQNQCLHREEAALEAVRSDLSQVDNLVKAISQTRAEAIRKVEQYNEAVRETDYLEIAERGLWPEGKDYFYLQKSLLSTVGYSPFMPWLEAQYGGGMDFSARLDKEDPRDDKNDIRVHRLTPLQVLLFGITPEETEAINEAYSSAVHRFIEITCFQIELCAPPNEAPNSEGFPCYLIPKSEGDESYPAEEFSAAVRNILGAERAGYFLPRAVETLKTLLESSRPCPIYIQWAGRDADSWIAYGYPGTGLRWRNTPYRGLFRDCLP